VKTLEDEACKKGTDAAGDLSTLPQHLADLGTDSHEQDISLGLMENETDELHEIQEAFERIKDGSFGLCETCKKKIPKERLKAIPYARLCVACKKKERRGLDYPVLSPPVPRTATPSSRPLDRSMELACPGTLFV
jgi:RNA polymerase-binding transcription factor DksA